MQNFEKTLQASLENLHSVGRLYFAPKQLFYEFCRTLRLPFAIDLKKYAPIIGTVSSLVRPYKTLDAPIAFGKFEQFLHEYLQSNKIEGLLKIEKEVKFANKFPNDLMLYGLPKVLICETDEIAQMLRANQFHLQTPCAVLSLGEANPLSENFKKMLSNAEEPQVFFLHDASLSAFSALRNLRKTLDLSEGIPLRPLGLRPVHARRLQLFAEKNVSHDFDFSEFDYLTESEKNWLIKGNSAEVSAVSPVRLMRVLRRLILGLEIPQSEWQIALPQKSLGFM